MRIFILFFIFIFNYLISNSQINAPALVCTQKSGNSITLTWRPPSEACGTFVKYYIFYSPASSNTFTILDSVTSFTTTTYTHTGVGSGQEFCYYMTSSYNCAGTSLHSDTLCSTLIPKPSLESISIENGHPVYTWIPYPLNKNIWGYIIFTPGGKVIDTARGRQTGSYTDLGFDPQSGIYLGAVASMDTCGGVNGRSGFEAHRPCFLSLVNNSCESEIQLSWTKYQGWTTTDDVKDYEIWVQKNSDPEKLVATNPSNILDFRYNDFVYGDKICIRVKANHPTKPAVYSYSNQICFISSKSQKPKLLQTLSASFLDNQKVKVRWYCSPDAIPLTFDVQKVNPKNNMKMMEDINVQYINEGNGYYSYTDIRANLSQQVSYRVIYQDLCNNKSDGEIGKNNFIKVTQTGLYNNEISWPKSYFSDSLPYTISKYEILYSKDQINYLKLSEALPSEYSYSHNLEADYLSTGKYCYKLIIYYKFDTTKPIKDSSFSMTSQTECIDMRTVLWMPNAFKVNGYTPTFKPKMYFFDYGIFSMKIFNRWGQKIFETNDANQGWNGIMNNGELAPEDSYIYYISYRGNDGTMVEKNGNFVLIR